MTPAADRFRQHCVSGIRKFVQTAVIIDNEAYLEPAELTDQNKVREAVRTSASVLEPDSARQENGDAKPDSAEPRTTIVSAAIPNSAHTLDAKTLTNAFHELEIVCGVYKPDAANEPVTLATKAAHHADIVIIDWFLDTTKTSAKAKDIVKSVLRRDTAEHGRLRLIAIYTGEQNLQALATDLLGEMNNDGEILSGGRFEATRAGTSLIRDDVKICFLNKEAIGVADLPERLLQEFAEVTEGILANFAVSAIAALRRSAHHIAALFRRELDGAYLAHRSRLTQPEDAKQFAGELIGDEFGSVISMAGIADECLSSDVLDDWVDHVTANNQHEFKSPGGAAISADAVKGLLAKGFKAVKGTLGVGEKFIERIFFKNAEQTWSRSFEFARLATLRTELTGRTRFPANWAPMLTLGTLVKVVQPEGQQGQAEAQLPSEYLVCVQPVCHSVRLDQRLQRSDGTVSFPFQTATVGTQSEPGFNLAVRDEQANNVDLLVGWKPMDGIIFRFRPDPVRQAVLATKDASGNYIFTNDTGRSFIWLGDIKTDAAQRNASVLASYIHTPGTNEFEWLREAAQKKIDFDGKASAAAAGPAETQVEKN